jgi:DNA-binding LytR/AlgR family response regulator
MHILIAEDETPARSELRYLLEELEPDGTFYEAADGEEALRIVEREPIDVAFLDIRMPGLDGLAVAATILEKPEPPLIVFATAYNEHALQAFELAALDYVVKPFDERRLDQTIMRARQTLIERAALVQKRAALRGYLQDTPPLTRLWAQRDNDDWVLLDYDHVLWVVAEEGKVYVQAATNGKLLVRHTLKELESRLIPHQFVRVHKSYLVNVEHVTEVAPMFSGTFVIRMDDEAGTQLPLSRGYVAQFKNSTGWNE